MAVAGLSDVGLDFRLLGPLEVWADGRPLRLAGRSQRALLSLLLLHANEVVSSDRLIEEIVGSRSGGTAANALQAAVSRLRRALGDGGGHIVTRSPGYLLQSAPEMIDRVRFERLYAQGREALRGGDPRRAALSLREALALWRGEPLADLAGYQFAAGERLRLNELRFAVVLERIDADLGLGRHAGLVAELEPLVLDHPLDQRLRAQHMLALYRSGRDADALRAYQEARTELVHELGVEPGTELRELQRAILEQAPRLDLVARPVAAGSARADFVGRERELAELSAGLNDAFAGHGRVYLLAGEPGIGKSRLAEEVVDRARAAGSRVLIGRCWEAGGAPAFWPWVQALRAYVRGTDAAILRTQLGAGAGDIANLLPELRGLFPDLGVPTTLQSDSARFRLFSAVSAFLVAAAETAPLTLVLDDLHASDEPSLLLLEFLTRSVGDARILVVAAYRDVDPTVREPLSAALAELAREPVTRRLVLSGLQQREVARIIERIAGEVPGEGLVEAIYLETEGNPFFAGEIVRLLAPQGHLDGRNPTRHAIPQTVRDVVSRRLRHLSSECNRLLVLASVLGREFPLDLLAHLGDVAPDDLGTLDEAVYERVLVDVPDDPDQLRFAHVIIRDALYDRLTSARRVRLHRLAVEALEALGKDDPGSRLAGLAHHSIAGRDFSRGCVYARRAGDRASTLLAFEEAARLYEVALGVGETAGLTDEERCELLVTLGDVQARAGDMPAARVSFVRAAELATAHGSTELLARAALGYGGRFLFTRDTEDRRIVTLLEAAAHALGEEESRLSVRVLTRLGNAVSQHAPGSASVLTGRAVEIARRLNDPTTIGYAISGRLWATRAPVDLDERLILTRELTAVDDSELAFEGHILQYLVLAARGDVAHMHEELATQERLADELGQPSQRWWVAAHGAQLALLEGRLADAEELIVRALRLGERAQSYDAPVYFQVQQFALRREQGRLAEVLPGLEQAVHGDPGRPLLRCVLAVAYWELGRREDAGRLSRELAMKDFAQLSVNNDWLLAAALLAELASSTDDAKQADVLYRRLSPFDGLNVDTFEVSTGAVSRYLGLLAATTGRFTEAGRHFEDAMAMNERMGAQPWFAHSQSDYAALLLARGDVEDRRRAQQLLGQALSIYEELGMENHGVRTLRTDTPGAASASRATHPG